MIYSILSEADIVGNKQLLLNMKKIKTVHHKAAPEHMDTPSGINLPNPFAEIHSDLYNSMDNKEDIIVKKQRLHEAVNVNDPSLFTPSIIKAAAKSLKSRKNDVTIQYESNSLTNAPDVLYNKLANLFKAFNGTQQGIFYLSPILFPVYMEGLLIKLRESGSGCYIGTVAYCDDYLHLSPTRNIANISENSESYLGKLVQLSYKKEESLQCPHHLLVQLQDCEEDDIAEELLLLIQHISKN